MPYSCSISTCKFKSIAKCPCCNKHLCRTHFLQHDLSIRSKYHYLNGQIDELTQQTRKIDIEKLTNEFIFQLDQWRFNSHRIIDEFYQKKSNELHNCINDIVNKREDDIIRLKYELAEIINQQKPIEKDFQILTSNIHNLKQKINQIKRISIQFNINPLIISDDLINFHLSKPQPFDLTGLKLPCQRIARIPFSSDALSSNDQYLLLHQNSNLFLINENLNVKNDKKWPHGWIRDMCWSQTLNSFILITHDEIYLVKQDTLKIKHLKTIKDKSWQCCTCSDISLYLSKDLSNSTIDEYSLKPSIQLIKHHQQYEIINEKQRIDSMKYNNDILAFIINNQTKKEIYFELKSIITFQRLWICQLSIEYCERKMQCCSLDCHGWMIMDPESSSFIRITEDGNITNKIKYNEKIYSMNLFGTNTMVISCQETINFHQL